ncbi:MAG: TolC family protein [Bacteroidetes bacterium]|nr:TolC family protein [Bacteroidota bacterium]
MDSSNVANCDTLYNIGQKRLEIASLSQADVLTLKVDALNARNKLAEAHKDLKNAQYLFNSFLRKGETSFFDLEIPVNLYSFQINFNDAYNLALINNPNLLENKLQLLESERNLDQAKKEGLWSASLTGSYGFNQQDSTLPMAYQNPLNQQRATIGVSIPIIDWGQRKGSTNMAKMNYEVAELILEQAEVDFKQELMMAVNNYNMQQSIVNSALETKTVANLAYDFTKQRFLIGKADVNSLGLALTRQDEANINYLEALRLYWKYYYTARRLTLHDFKNNSPLVQNLDTLIGL